MGASQYGSIADHGDLLDWARAYAREVRRKRGVDVRFDTVSWEVSTRAKRRAAALKRPKVSDATIGTEIEWGTVEHSDRSSEPGPLPCTISLTWGAFEAFDRAELESVVRHELVHLEQFQRYGTTDHGPAFRQRAEELDTEVHCQIFTTPKYVVRCADCEGLVARRYQDCKLVRERDQYRSDCCDASLTCEQPAD